MLLPTVILQDKILKLLRESEGNILDDEQLLNTLNNSKRTSADIQVSWPVWLIVWDDLTYGFFQYSATAQWLVTALRSMLCAGRGMLS
jgi:uncharacterized protein YyaL (SSP411 family)